MNTHSFSDLAKLQRDGQRLFHSLFVFENYPVPKGEGKGITISMRNAIEKVDYPLSILAFDSNNTLIVKLQYDGKYLTEERASHHIATLENILHHVVKNPTLSHNKISLLSAADQEEIIYNWNATEKEYPKDKTIHELFQEQAEKTPDNIALVYEGQSLTYKALNEKSNQLARHIRKQYKERTGQEMQPDTLVALCLDRSLEMVIAILGVLKAGGAYVPMDPAYPQDRIDYLLGDTKAELILTQQQVREGNALQLAEEKVVLIDLREELYRKEENTNLSPRSTANDLAYVIYTSGTTGRPKGVMVEHRSLMNLVFIQRDRYEVGAKSKVLQYASLVFDASVWEIFSALSFGAELYILPTRMRQDAHLVSGYLAHNKIAVTLLPPALLSVMASTGLEHLKVLLVGGDLSSLDLMHQWSKGRRLINAYGPTENTVCATMHKYEEGDLNTNIGRPLDNTGVYVVDSNLTPVPIGVIGELYIGGAGLSRGYLNNEALTAERFVANPFAREADKLKGYTRLYKTGDLVRWLADGNLEYIGRNDEQVKIRGYRIELGEIEHALAAIEGIKQACVLARERKTDSGVTKYLVAYYVLDQDGEALTQNVIADKLSTVLPEYMVPGTLMPIDSLPLTINGKLDKRALPDPDFSSQQEYVAPRTETEKVLVRIWQEVLGVERVGVTDNFFRIGGDSILSIQVSSRMRQAGFACQVKDIFSYKTIEKLSAYLDNNQSAIAIKSEQGVLTGSFGLLPIQQWFTDRIEKGELAKPNHWNQSFLIRVPELDQNKLFSIIKELVAYHDVLRVRYQKSEGWQQVYQAAVEIPALKTLDVRHHTQSEVQRILTDWQSGFDLEQGPLFQAGYLYGYEDGSARIYFALHHMIVDGVSWRILAEDIRILYEGKKLPVKGSSYRQWVGYARLSGSRPSVSGKCSIAGVR